MATTECNNGKMIHSSGSKTVVTEWHDGTIEFFENGCGIKNVNFTGLSLADYGKLICDFFPGQVIRYQ
jgi:hypothetical protein